MKIAIAGPGRSGTSLLVRLLDKFGFTTPPSKGNWSEEAQAGLEARIGADTPYEVDKDPWAYEYIERIGIEVLRSYDAFVVPIRDLQHASISRSVLERLHRAKYHDQDYWKWDSWGTVPGGAISRVTTESIASTLSVGLWHLLEKASLAGLHPIILHFPRFATDFDYFWAMMKPIVLARQSEESARMIWNEVVDPGRIRIADPDGCSQSAEVRVLHAMIDSLRKERNQSAAERDLALAQLQAIRSSRRWRLDRLFRNILSSIKNCLISLQELARWVGQVRRAGDIP